HAHASCIFTHASFLPLTRTPAISTLSLHDALPIFCQAVGLNFRDDGREGRLIETDEERQARSGGTADPDAPPDETGQQRGKTVHGDPANAGHRVLAPDDAEVEAYPETALKAPAPARTASDHPA